MTDPHARRKLVAGIALLIFFTIALIGEAMADRIMRFWLGVILCSFVSLIVAVFLLVSGAHARDLDGRYADAPNHEWFESQHNSAGGWCCNDADGHEYDGDYSVNADGSVTTEWEGKPYHIDGWKVLKGANPTGHAVWWYLIGMNGEPSTFCFSPGPLT